MDKGDPEQRRTTVPQQVKELLLGKPRDLQDRRLFHRLALIPFLAWVGLGADGLSSSSYGPQEAFRALGDNTFLAVAIAGMMAFTVILIASAYSRIIEQFPHGGGGYVVATKLLGPRAGVVSGSALLVDYVLTIATSIAAAGDAIFSFLPPHLIWAKLPFEGLAIIGLTTLNIRGVKESVMVLVPIFLVFLATHVVVIVGGIAFHAADLPATVQHVRTGYSQGMAALGAGGLALLFARAYSLGGGTYTGIEAVSNGLPIMREPRVQTGRRTMFYMAASLAFTAAGLLVCYLLWHVQLEPGKTANASLLERMTAGLPFGATFLVVTLVSEGALLVVAAQAGFIDGPRVLANMAVDSWVPHRFSALSDRLTTQNGIVLMGATSLAALAYTRGRVGALIVMYSINVFLTFSLSMFGMLRHWVGERAAPLAQRARRILLFGAGFVLCGTILVVTVMEKFAEGGWLTVVVTAALVTLCFVVRKHYRGAAATMERLYAELGTLPTPHDAPAVEPDPKQPVAVVLVASYSGLGIHTVLNVFRAFPGFYQGLVFISVGVVDSGEFKGEGAVEELTKRTGEMLQQYVRLARGMEVPAAGRMAIGTDAVDTAEALCLAVAKEFPKSTFFSGKMIFQRERWYHALLHNNTALALQTRLQWAGKTMVTLPVRLREA
jgi:amino acid transporter